MEIYTVLLIHLEGSQLPNPPLHLCGLGFHPAETLALSLGSGKAVGRQAPHTLSRASNGGTPMEGSLMGSQNDKRTLACTQQPHFLGHVLHLCLCTRGMGCKVTHCRAEKPTWSSTGYRLNKPWDIHTMKGCTVVKTRRKILGADRKKFQDILLNGGKSKVGNCMYFKISAWLNIYAKTQDAGSSGCLWVGEQGGVAKGRQGEKPLHMLLKPLVYESYKDIRYS